MIARPAVARYYADVPNRLVGYLIDLLILSFLAFVCAVVISLLLGPIVEIDLSTDPQVTLDQGLALLNGALATAVGAVYFIGSWRRSAGTPGQRMLRMRIGAETDGGAVTSRQGLIRWALLVLPLSVQASVTSVISGTLDAILFLVILAWYLYLLVSTARHPAKQGLHDRLAHTVVTKAGVSVPWEDEAEREPGAVVR